MVPTLHGKSWNHKGLIFQVWKVMVMWNFMDKSWKLECTSWKMLIAVIHGPSSNVA